MAALLTRNGRVFLLYWALPLSARTLEGVFADFSGGAPLWEDSPEDCTLVEDERGIVFCAYDEAGFPHELVLRARVAQPAPSQAR